MRDRTVGDTFFIAFSTRAFATGAPTTLAGAPVISAYEDAGLVQITAGITVSVDHDAVTGLNMLTIVATGANGFEAGKDYNLVITTGTVGGVSVIGEVVGQFSLESSAAFARLGAPSAASVSDDIAAVKADTAAVLIDTSTTLDTKINDIQGATFDTLTDSLESIRDRGDAAWITGGGGGDPWLTLLPGAYTAGQAGKIVGDNLDATVTSRLAEASINTTGGAVDTVTVNTDMRGTDGANTTAPDNISIAAILADTADMQPKLGTPVTDISADIAAVKVDTNALATDWADGGRLDLLIDQLITQIDTPVGEPGQIAPPVSAKMGLKVDYIYKFLRNRSTSTASVISVYADDAATVDHKATHADDGTTYDRQEFTAGP